jgi:hypothetical protein
MIERLRSLHLRAGELGRQAGHGRLQRSIALLTALGALGNGFESYVEHRRGAYRNRWMWTPVVIAPLAGAVAVAAILDERVARRLLPWASLALLADGMTGTYLHLRGVGRMPGGLSFGTYNVSMGPPIFAPFLMGSVGLIGLVAAALRPERLRPEAGEPWR